MTKLKMVLNKLRQRLCQLYLRKELRADAIRIALAMLIVYVLPLVYAGVADIRWRVAIALALVTAEVRMVVDFVRGLIRRNVDLQLGKIRIPRMLLGIFFIVLLVGAGASLTAQLGQPPSGIYALEVSEGRKRAVMGINSVLFALCSQAFLTVCTMANQEDATFIKGLGKILLYTCVPMSLLAFLETIFINKIGTETIGGNALAILMTVFLWITSIAVNESIHTETKETVCEQKS